MGATVQLLMLSPSMHIDFKSWDFFIFIQRKCFSLEACKSALTESYNIILEMALLFSIDFYFPCSVFISLFWNVCIWKFINSFPSFCLIYAEKIPRSSVNTSCPYHFFGRFYDLNDFQGICRNCRQIWQWDLMNAHYFSCDAGEWCDKGRWQTIAEFTSSS